MITIFLTAIHVLVCVFLIIVVLLQSGKAADLAGAFGGMGSQTAFGPRGSATLLSKATTISAIVFMLTSMSLSIFATRGAGSRTVLDGKSGKAAPQGNVVNVTPVTPATKGQAPLASPPITVPQTPAAGTPPKPEGVPKK